MQKVPNIRNVNRICTQFNTMPKSADLGVIHWDMFSVFSGLVEHNTQWYNELILIQNITNLQNYSALRLVHKTLGLQVNLIIPVVIQFNVELLDWHTGEVQR